MRPHLPSRVAALLVAALLAGCSTGDVASSDPAGDASATATATASGTGAAPGSAPDRGEDGSSRRATTRIPLPAAELQPTPAPAEEVFADRAFLVAYYGTAQTPTMGVLGESSPAEALRRLEEAAAPFERGGRRVVPVFELIVTVADPVPGPDGDYSHDIPRSEVRRYVEASRELGVRLLLDVQPGRSDFLPVAKRWSWALREPHVGLALDPEWRMAPDEVPGEVIGEVRAEEVNRVSRWLADLQTDEGLPQKLFVLHQFRTDMLPDVEDVVPRPELATVQHVDGFGPPGQKIETYGVVARPKQFAMGFKLFYDEDVDLMSAAQVQALRPRVRFVSFQ